MNMTVNELLTKGKFKGDETILMHRKADRMCDETEYTAKELKGCKKQVFYARAHYGGVKHKYNAYLILTER